MKDGCSPQGQCGCCTVWVDGQARVACVTPLRRTAGREVTTLEGLPDELRERWGAALLATGGSQCGFCTPGILMRLAALDRRREASSGSPSPGSGAPAPAEGPAVDRALLAHLCRCTGWQTIEEAARAVSAGGSIDDRGRDLDAAAARATLEGGADQRVGIEVVLGAAGFADDTAPPRAPVAVPDPTGALVLGATPKEARRLAARTPGRSTPAALAHPIALPEGEWALTLQTTWVEPGYLEPDAAWCEPGGQPVSSCANGGAFGGKRPSPAEAQARRLADERGEAVRVLWSREDVVRFGPKRPPVAGGVRPDGTGTLRVGSPPGGFAEEAWSSLLDQVAAVAPGLALEQVELPGPPLSLDLRAAVWAEAAALAVVARLGGARDGAPRTGLPVEVTGPSGARAVATCREDGSIGLVVDAGPPGDEVVLRSYCIGATHQALGLVCSEGIAVDAEGVVHDLTVRSFGILQARAMPRVDVSFEQRVPGAVNGSDAAFAAVAAARWLAEGAPPAWPTDRR